MTNNSYISNTRVPDIAHQRSRFVVPWRHGTTALAGKLTPFMYLDCLPGSTYSFDTSFFCRMLTPIFPVMDDCYLNVSYFFVPYRLLWSHWKEFQGENNSVTTPWVQPAQYNVPHTYVNTQALSGVPFQNRSVADHFGMPTDVYNVSVSSFPFRAYCFIYNSFFRNQNTDIAAYWNDTDLDIQSGTAAYQGGQLLDVCREHDYFSDALPTAEKLSVPAGIAFPDTDIPVITLATEHTAQGHSVQPMKFASGVSGSSFTRAAGVPYVNLQGVFHVPATSQDTGINNPLIPTNTYADLGAASVDMFTVNQIRQAFAMQRYGERLALGGSRYTEILSSFFGLTSQDSRLDRPEFLGSQSWSINMSQVVQTSSTDSVSPQGNVAGNSVTSGKGARVVYSTQEHGCIIGLFWIRHRRSYQQGIDRMFSRRTKFDFFLPPFSRLGLQPLYNKEIYADGSANDDKVFGYVPYAEDYRKPISHVSGMLRRNFSGGSLSAYTYADYYSTRPTLSQAWMAEGYSEIGNTLAQQSVMYDQFILEFAAKLDMTLPIPLSGVPGLVDHF